MTKVGVLGSGIVGQTLADGFIRHGYAVMRGSRSPEKLADWKAGAGRNAEVGSFADTAKFADLVVLAVKGTAAESVLDLCGAANLAGKVVIDTTNPIAERPPVNGVLEYFVGPNESLMERLQAKVPGARFVKAFSCVGAPLMVNPDFGGVKPTMFIAGNDESGKREVARVLDQFGWEVADMGGVLSARGIEPLCILWCIPGLSGGSWSHAFKLLRK